MITITIPVWLVYILVPLQLLGGTMLFALLYYFVANAITRWKWPRPTIGHCIHDRLHEV